MRNSRYQVVGLVVGGGGLLAIAIFSRFFYGDKWKWGAGIYGAVAVGEGGRRSLECTCGLFISAWYISDMRWGLWSHGNFKFKQSVS